jgi:hypothetical protein
MPPQSHGGLAYFARLSERKIARQRPNRRKDDCIFAEFNPGKRRPYQSEQSLKICEHEQPVSEYIRPPWLRMSGVRKARRYTLIATYSIAFKVAAIPFGAPVAPVHRTRSGEGKR